VGNPGSPRIEENKNPPEGSFERADKMTALAFEQTPKPMKSRAAVRALILKCMRAEYDAERIEAAILAGGVTWTEPGLMFALNNPGRPHQPIRGRSLVFTDPRDVVYT
jgi:hypothetical protein